MAKTSVDIQEFVESIISASQAEDTDNYESVELTILESKPVKLKGRLRELEESGTVFKLNIKYPDPPTRFVFSVEPVDKRRQIVAHDILDRACEKRLLRKEKRCWIC